MRAGHVISIQLIAERQRKRDSRHISLVDVEEGGRHTSVVVINGRWATPF